MTALVAVIVLGSRLGDDGGRSGAEYSVGREDLGGLLKLLRFLCTLRRVLRCALFI